MFPTLTKEDFEQPRTQAQLRDWVDDLYRKSGQSSEGRAAMRLKNRDLKNGDLIKKFKEEIWPLALFADAFYMGKSDVLFKPIIGSEAHDALIIDLATRKTRHCLEITQSFDGRQDHLRMLHLEKYGRAPVTGPRLEEDKARGEVPETWPECAPHKSLLNQAFHDVKKAVQRKSKMRYKDTSLIVEVADRHVHSESDRQALSNFARSTLVPIAQGYAALYLVSAPPLAFRYDTRLHAG